MRNARSASVKEYRHLVAATDFSESAESALAVAAVLARRFGAHVDLVHAFAPSLFAAALPGADPDIRVKMLESAQHALEHVRHKHFGGVSVDPHALQADHAALSVVDHARGGANLIVVGTHGRKGLPRLMIGSVAEAIARYASCDVLVVPPSFDADTLTDRVVAATDFSPSSDVALDLAAGIAAPPLGVVNVMVPVGGDLEPLRSALSGSVFEEPQHTKQRLQDRLVTSCARLARDGVAPECEVVVDESAVAGLRAYAEKKDATLIVVGTHGRHGLDRLLMGSVAERIVRQPPCAVWIVRR